MTSVGYSSHPLRNAWLLFGVAGIACYRPPTSATSGTLAQMCQAQANARCAFDARCQSAYVPPDCANVLASNCVAAHLPVLDAGREGLVSAAAFATSCDASTLAQLPCTVVASIQVSQACTVSRGDVPLGGRCALPPDCQPSADGGAVYCVTTPGVCGGTCARGAALGEPCQTAPDYFDCATGFCHFPIDGGPSTCLPYATSGQPCDSDSSLCDWTSLYCDYQLGNPVCQPFVEPGQPCSFSGCVSGYWCSSTDGGFGPGTCVPTLAGGASCSPSDEGPCGPVAACVQAGFCAPFIGEPGDPCDAAQTTCEQGVCLGEGPGPGRCVDAGPAPTVGSACDGGDSSCAASGQTSFYQCLRGACAALPGAGQGCTDAGQCLPGTHCVMGQCEAPAEVGEACTPTIGCAESYCDPTLRVCQPFLAPGKPCDPSANQCGPYEVASTRADGGFLFRDLACTATGGGSPTCQAFCQ